MSLALVTPLLPPQQGRDADPFTIAVDADFVVFEDGHSTGGITGVLYPSVLRCSRILLDFLRDWKLQWSPGSRHFARQMVQHAIYPPQESGIDPVSY